MIIGLFAVVLALGLAILPANRASAAGREEGNRPPTGNKPHLEQAWAHLQSAYQRQTERLAAAESNATRVQSLIDRANQKGLAASTVQAAWNAFTAAIPDTQAVHAGGAPIISSHAGFDESGQVTNLSEAIATPQVLGQVLQDTRPALGGTGQVLREALKVFFEANRPASTDP